MSPQLTARPTDVPLQNLYSLLEPITSKDAKFTNWGQTFRCAPLAVFEPENEFQCELVLELARREGKTIRIVGVGHSPSDLTCTNEFMMRTRKLNRLLEVSQPHLRHLVFELFCFVSFLFFFRDIPPILLLIYCSSNRPSTKFLVLLILVLTRSQIAR